MDITLHDNGAPCPACELRRESRDPMDPSPIPCNTCGGNGRMGHTVHQVVGRSVEWARKHYWPERERRWAEQNARLNAATGP